MSAAPSTRQQSAAAPRASDNVFDFYCTTTATSFRYRGRNGHPDAMTNETGARARAHAGRPNVPWMTCMPVARRPTGFSRNTTRVAAAGDGPVDHTTLYKASYQRIPLGNAGHVTEADVCQRKQPYSFARMNAFDFVVSAERPLSGTRVIPGD